MRNRFFNVFLLALSGLSTMATALAQSGPVFSNRSLLGEYAIDMNEGNHDGRNTGLITYDGVGGLSGTLLYNLPMSDTERNIFRTPVVGTYSVDETGMVDQTWTLTDTPLGELTTEVVAVTLENFFQRATELRGRFSSGSFFVGEGDILVSFRMYRRRNRSEYSNSDLNGQYALSLDGGNRDAVAIGVLNYDGNGGLTGSFNVNDPNTPDPEVIGRQSFVTPLEGTYNVEPDGTITQTLTLLGTPGGPVNFDANLLIMQSSLTAATRMTGSFTTPSPFVPGALVGFTLRRRSGVPVVGKR